LVENSPFTGRWRAGIRRGWWRNPPTPEGILALSTAETELTLTLGGAGGRPPLPWTRVKGSSTFPLRTPPLKSSWCFFRPLMTTLVPSTFVFPFLRAEGVMSVFRVIQFRRFPRLYFPRFISSVFGPCRGRNIVMTARPSAVETPGIQVQGYRRGAPGGRSRPRQVAFPLTDDLALCFVSTSKTAQRTMRGRHTTRNHRGGTIKLAPIGTISSREDAKTAGATRRHRGGGEVRVSRSDE